MDYSPPVKIENVYMYDYNSKFYDEESLTFLSYVDNAFIPKAIRKLARDNDCRYIKENDLLGYRIYGHEGRVYHCVSNDKHKFIMFNGTNYHFATPYERIRYYKIFRKYYFF